MRIRSDDGFTVSAYDEGSGPVPVIIIGGGMDDGRSYARLAAELAATNRVLRVVRRQYDPKAARWRPVQIADEVSDVIALARLVGRPCYLFGHSSGGVVALETALAAPDLVDALAVFEPAIDLAALPLGRPEATAAARQAVDAGRTGRALEIFLRDVVQMPRTTAKLARLLTLSTRFRTQLIPGQIADQEALKRLGDRLAAYARITQRVLIVAGSKSPRHLRDRADLLQGTLPSSELRQLDRVGHGAPATDARVVGRLLLADLDKRFPGPAR